MLATILTGVIGLFGSALPHLFDLLKDSNENKQQLAMIDRQIELVKIKGDTRLDEIAASHDARLEEIQANSQAQQALAAYQLQESAQKSADTNTGVAWVDAFRGVVRPLVTVMFVGIWAYYKISHPASLWDEFDQRMTMLILCFWFGGRALEAYKRSK